MVSREINVLNLKPYHDRRDRNPGSKPISIDGVLEWEVDKIIADKKAPGRGNKKRYQVKQIGWGDEYDEWIHEDNLKHAQKIIDLYWANKKAKIAMYSSFCGMNVAEKSEETEGEVALFNELKRQSKLAKPTLPKDLKCDECKAVRKGGSVKIGRITRKK